MPSKLHTKIGIVLKSAPPFSGCSLKEEILVSDLFSYPNNRDRWDWVVIDLNLVIEGMGIQHDSPQAFGGDAEKALLSFNAQNIRDKKKKEAALNSGWIYIAIPQKDYDILDGNYLLDKYLESLNSLPLKEKKLETKYQTKQKQYRKEMYRKIKENRKSYEKK